ncbi:MAG: hypothetical protein H0V81_02885 [Solirubrobacterales bacterium]|nr:hypothetical protein [Solirubrobacterales bacterium]
MTDGPDTPQTPAREEPDNDDFGTNQETGEGGYPEEGPAGTDADGEPQEGRSEQPQREKG